MDINILILGGGVGGLVTANLLVKEVRRKGVKAPIKLIGESSMHTYQPSLLFLPFQRRGYRTLADIQKETVRFVGRGVEYLLV